MAVQNSNNSKFAHRCVMFSAAAPGFITVATLSCGVGKRIPSFPFCPDPQLQSYFLLPYSFFFPCFLRCLPPARDGPVTLAHRAGVATRSEQRKTAASAPEQLRVLQLGRAYDNTDSDSPSQYVQAPHVLFRQTLGHAVTACYC